VKSDDGFIGYGLSFFGVGVGILNGWCVLG